MSASTEHVLRRDGDRALRFRGALLGEGESGSGGQARCDWTRGWQVAIYRTDSGRYVVSRERWTRWEDESGTDEAWVADSPEALLASLRYDDEMPPAELHAWEAACKADPDLGAIAEEVID